jgi:hypothetical protein
MLFGLPVAENCRTYTHDFSPVGSSNKFGKFFVFVLPGL